MAVGAIISLAFFVVLLGSVGVRLVLLWRRTRHVPEASLGFGLVIVAVGLPISAIGRAPATALEPIGRLSFALGLATSMAGVALMVFFHYRVFRPDARWARVLFCVICAAMAAAVAYMGVANFQGATLAEIKTRMRPGTITLIVTTMVCFGWASVESLRYYAAVRRRLSLGLADPVVVNRFLLWGIAGATCTTLLATLVVCVLQGMTVMREPLPLAALAASGLVMSASWYLTFFAPAGYQRLLRERAARRRSGGAASRVAQG